MRQPRPHCDRPCPNVPSLSPCLVLLLLLLSEPFVCSVVRAQPPSADIAWFGDTSVTMSVQDGDNSLNGNASDKPKGREPVNSSFFYAH